MSHTLTQPEEVELFWKEMSQGNITHRPHESKTESVREGGLGNRAPAYQAANNPAQGGASRRC